MPWAAVGLGIEGPCGVGVCGSWGSQRCGCLRVWGPRVTMGLGSRGVGTRGPYGAWGLWVPMGLRSAGPGLPSAVGPPGAGEDCVSLRGGRPAGPGGRYGAGGCVRPKRWGGIQEGARVFGTAVGTPTPRRHPSAAPRPPESWQKKSREMVKLLPLYGSGRPPTGCGPGYSFPTRDFPAASVSPSAGRWGGRPRSGVGAPGRSGA